MTSVQLSELMIAGNPMCDTVARKEDIRVEVLRRLPKLKKLEGKMVTDDEIEAAMNPDWHPEEKQ